MADRLQKYLDGSALGISMICLLHCLAIPLAATLGPYLGVELLLGDETKTHLILFGVALPVSFIALGWSFQRHGKNDFLFILAATGLVLMFAATQHDIVGDNEIRVTVIGVTLVALAHTGNWLRVEWKHRKEDKAAAAAAARAEEENQDSDEGLSKRQRRKAKRKAKRNK